MRKKTSRKWTWLIVAVIATLLMITAFAINLILAPIAAKKLTAAVQKGSRGHYTLKFVRLQINVFTGTAELDGVQLIPDRLLTDTQAVFVSAQTHKIVVSGVQVLHFMLHHQLAIGSIQLTDPDLSITRRHSTPAKPKSTETLDQQLATFAKSISVDAILLNNARFDFTDSARKPANLHLQQLDLVAHKLLIAPGSSADTTRTLLCKEISATLNHFSGYTHDNAYHYTLTKARFSTLDHRLTLKGMALEPLPPNQFFKKMRTDRFEFSLDSLAVEDFNYRGFLDGNLLQASHISGYRGKLDVFGNPHGVIKPGDRIAGFPQVILRRMPTRIAADTLDLSQINVSYREINPANGQTGKLSFLKTSARFLHITNIPERLKDQPWCKVNIHSLFMGRGQFSAALAFKLSDPMVTYTIRGELGPISIQTVNTITVPLALANIESGELNALTFDIQANRNKSTGTMHLLYHDLSVEMLRPDDSQKPLQTLLVNTLVIKHNNPDQAGQPPRFAKIIFLRPKSYPFFKTIWNTLFNGIKSCAGVGPVVQPKPKESLTNKINKVMSKLFKRAQKQKAKANTPPATN